MRLPLVVTSWLLVACAASDAPPLAMPPPTPATAIPTLPEPTPSSMPATPVPGGAPRGHLPIPPFIQAALDAPDRDAEDRALDAGRHPAELLAFFGIAPAMKVGEIAAATGYTTELLARVVGAGGVVFAENPKLLLRRFAAKPWAARLAKPVTKNVRRSDHELDAPFPPEAKDLDAVVDVLFYHDTVWLEADRGKMNAAIFAALKPGGVYGIVDHSGRPGSGTSEVESLHRIEEKQVIDEVTRAGFTLAAEADFLRNPADARDWDDSPGAVPGKRGTSDRFVLKFTRP